ncbi:MAG: hypothetical protein IJO05_06685 [Oscillospiraceae bacterium]|nr:hypothetical protein [Oscillospiraceae bacterium]
MKDLKRSARTLNWLLNAAFLFLVLRGIFAAGFHSVALYKLFTDPAALSGKMGLTIDWLTLDAASGFGIDLDTAVYMKLVHLISAVIITVIACQCVHRLKHILLPIELGQPFRTGIAGDIRKLAWHYFCLGWAENLSMLASVILIENHYGLHELLTTGPITNVLIHPEFRPAWFFVTAMLVILAMVFRHGEQLQTLADETL